MESITPGEWIHAHNIKTALSDEKEYIPDYPHISINQPDITINAYLRENGDFTIKNELWVIPTAGCVNAIARQMITRFEKENTLSGIDGICLSPPYGCSQFHGGQQCLDGSS